MLTQTSNTANGRRLRRIFWIVVVGVIALHVLVGIIAGIWVVARYFDKPEAQFVVERRVAIDPEKRQQRLESEKMESLRPKPVYSSRITSLRPTSIALPELPKMPVDQIVPLDTQAMVNDQIDSLAGGQAGQSAGGGSGGFFGGSGKAGSGLLAGVFYDLKQTSKGQPSGIDPGTYRGVVQDFARGWNVATLNKFYRAPGTLYARRVLMPLMDANKAPEAFDVGGKVQPSLWLVHYQGRVIAPATGSYRFVGIGDDLLLVRFNGRIVLDGSFPNARIEESRQRYVYPGTFADEGYQRIYEDAGGHAVGSIFNVEKGKAYDIAILVGESPGVFFGAFLQIEKVGGNYKRDAKGNPIVPYFEMERGSVRGEFQGKYPPGARTDEVWTPASEKASSPFGLP